MRRSTASPRLCQTCHLSARCWAFGAPSRAPSANTVARSRHTISTLGCPRSHAAILSTLRSGSRSSGWCVAPPAPSREEFFLAHPKDGRLPKHGGEFVLGDPALWGQEQAVTVADTRPYGKATAQAWDRLHPRPTQRAAWLDHDGPLPVIEGTVIRLTVEHLPPGGVDKPVWLWWSRTGATAADIDRCWQAFLRRFDIEHTFRMLEQTLGWTRPRLRDSAAADRWTWLINTAHTQLCLARPPATDLRRPWEKPAPPDKLTPARVRRGFPNLRPTTGSPSGAPKPTTATRHDVGRVLTGSGAYQRRAHHKVGTKPDPQHFATP
jgi:hypothetical protein